MTYNLPQKVRLALYLIVVFGTAVLVPLHSSNAVSDLVFNVWTSVAGAASALAAYNVSSK